MLPLQRALLLLVLLCLLPQSGLCQGKADVPDGDTMKEYMDDLDSYIDKWRQKAQQLENQEIQKHLENWQKGKVVNKWDRGSDEAEQNNKDDLKEMKKYYDNGECSEKHKVGMCKTCLPWPLSLFFPPKPYWFYRFPVHKIEVTEVPFRTGYMKKNDVKKLMQKAFEEKYQGLDKIHADQNKKMNEQAKKQKWAWSFDNQADSDAIAKAKEQDEKYRFRSNRLAGGTWAFPHVFDAKFHKEYQQEYKDHWGHDGAILAERKYCKYMCPQGYIKRPVPTWFAEGPKSSNFFGGNSQSPVQTFFNSIVGYNYKSKSGEAKLAKISIGKDTKETGRVHNYEEKTPRDILPEKQKKELDESECGTYTHETVKEDKCLPGQNGEKGPMTGWVKDLYHTRAAIVAMWRGLFWVTAIEDDGQGKYKTSLDDQLGKKYHPYYNKDRINMNNGSIHPRELLQILSTGEGRHNRYPKGCKPWKDQEYFTPDWSGPEYGDAIMSKTDDRNHTTVMAQWRFMRNCQIFYELAQVDNAPRDLDPNWY